MGTLLKKSRFPQASQGPAAHAGLSKESSLKPAVLTFLPIDLILNWFLLIVFFSFLPKHLPGCFNYIVIHSLEHSQLLSPHFLPVHKFSLSWLLTNFSSVLDLSFPLWNHLHLYLRQTRSEILNRRAGNLGWRRLGTRVGLNE